jgi:hypothetical protein
MLKEEDLKSFSEELQEQLITHMNPEVIISAQPE